jgi:hypothetical protein
MRGTWCQTRAGVLVCAQAQQSSWEEAEAVRKAAAAARKQKFADELTRQMEEDTRRKANDRLMRRGVMAATGERTMADAGVVLMDVSGPHAPSSALGRTRSVGWGQAAGQAAFVQGDTAQVAGGRCHASADRLARRREGGGGRLERTCVLTLNGPRPNTCRISLIFNKIYFLFPFLR